MEAYVLIGLFIDTNELEKLKIYEKVLIQEKVLPKTSCDHLPVHNYFKNSSKSCPTCNIPISIIKGSEPIYKKGLVGYKPIFFRNPLMSMRQRCKHNKKTNCNNFCISCKKFCNSCMCPNNCLYIIDICNPDLYHNLSKRCNCYEYLYYGLEDCLCKVIDYDVPLDKIKGFDLLNINYVHKLTWDDEEGFVILCESFKISKHYNTIEIIKRYIKMKKEIEEFVQQFGIKDGDFEIRVKFIKN